VYWNNYSVITLIPVDLNGADVNNSYAPQTDVYIGYEQLAVLNIS